MAARINLSLGLTKGLMMNRSKAYQVRTLAGNAQGKQGARQGKWSKKPRRPMRGALGVKREVPEGMKLVPLAVREEIFKAYTLNPTQNSFTALAKEYNYRPEKVAAIVRLVEREKDIEAEEGFESLGAENLDEAARLLFGQDKVQLPTPNPENILTRDSNIKYIQVDDSYTEEKTKEKGQQQALVKDAEENDETKNAWTKLDEELKDMFWKSYKPPADVFKTEGSFVFRDISKQE